MIRNTTLSLRAALALAGGALCLTLTAAGAGLQDPGQEAAPQEEAQEEAQDEGLDLGELNPFRQQQEQESAQDEMVRLFQEVETSLNNMGGLLFDASKGETGRLDELGSAGIDDILDNAPENPDTPQAARGSLASLLAASEAEGASVLEGIDRILEIAQQHGNGT